MTSPSRGETTYTWAGGASAPWGTPSSWSPPRVAPAADDVLHFAAPPAITVTAIPRETIGQLRVSGSTVVNLQAGVAVDTLSIVGSAGIDLSVPAGAALNINSLNALRIELRPGAVAEVGGNMTLSGGPHRIDAAAPDAIVFLFASTFTQGAGCTGAVFSNAGVPAAITFRTGATFIALAGSPPFGLPAPASRVTFQSGSFYKHRHAGAPELSGRNYGHLDINPPVGTILDAAGAEGVTLDNWTITTGRLNVALTAEIRLRGRLQVQSGATLEFNPPSPGTLAFIGSAPQLVLATGTILFGTQQRLRIANPVGVGLVSPLALGGDTTVEPGALLSVNASVVHSGTLTVDGTFQRGPGGSVTGTPLVYGPGGALIYNHSSGVVTIGPGDVVWPEEEGPGDVAVLTTGAATGISLAASRHIPVRFRASGRVGFEGGSLTLGGECRLLAGGRFDAPPIYAPGSLLVYDTGGLLARGAEWSTNAGAGFPRDILVVTGTALDITGSGDGSVPCALRGDFTVEAGASVTLALAGGSRVPLHVAGDARVAGSLELSPAPGGDLEVVGELAIPGSLIAHAREIRCVGASAQGVSSVGPLTRLVIQNPADVHLDGELEVIDRLEFVTGRFVTGSHVLRLGPLAAVYGAGATRYVVGTLERTMPGAGIAGVVLDIGDSLAFAPVTVRVDGAHPGGGRVRASTRGGDHAAFGSAGLDPDRSVHRSWSVTTEALGSAAADLTFRYPLSDADSGIGFDSLEARRHDGTSWSDAVPVAAEAGTVELAGQTEFGDYQFGECATYTVTAMAGPHGYIAPAPTVLARFGAEVSFIIVPDAGFAIQEVRIDGGSIGAVSNYTFTALDANHTIEALFRDDECPAAVMIGPRGGETFIVGLTQAVLWDAVDNVEVVSVDLELSRTGFEGPFEPLATGLPNLGRHDWRVSGPMTDDAVIRVVAIDAVGNRCPVPADNRCRIIDWPTPARTLGLAGRVDPAGFVLEWTLDDAERVALCRVERAASIGAPWAVVSGPLDRPNDGRGSMRWVDDDVVADRRYAYRVRLTLRDGREELSEPVELLVAPPAEATIRVLAAAPFRGAPLRFTVVLAAGGPCRIDLLDVAGRLVTRLHEGPLPPGWHRFEWSDRGGEIPASGLYFLRAATENARDVARVTLLR